MNPDDDEGRLIAEAIRQVYRDADLPWPPAPGGGPVPLNHLIEAHNLVHEEVPGLCHAVVASMLELWGVRGMSIPDPDPPLAGFLYANSHGGRIFVRRGDILPRRRFTAAHELGHHRLHLAPALAEGASPPDGLSIADDTITESDEAKLTAMERQANRFAAELLMPEAVCRTLFAQYAEKYGPTDRFLVYHLAGELLVSREAAGWRLFRLGLIAKPTWMKAEPPVKPAPPELPSEAL